ncbi:MAG: diaminopimelate epimerase [Nitrospinota bacterium]
MAIQFTKMSGSGNDFVVIDNRVPVMEDSQKVDFVKRVCDRKMSVGADGVIFVENSDKADIKWDFYNDDGSSAEMCGNGGRCVARYAVEKGIAPNELTLETIAGIIEAKVDGKMVRVKLTAPENLKQDIVADFNGTQYEIDSLNTGVPHAIIYSDNVENVNVKEVGNGIRFHDVFAPAGTNVNFVEKVGDHDLKIRTYERGVEDETLACGTGTVASALLSSYKNMVKPPVKVETRGGEILKVDFDPSNGSDVFLEGLTRISYEGTLGEY